MCPECGTGLRICAEVTYVAEERLVHERLEHPGSVARLGNVLIQTNEQVGPIHTFVRQGSAQRHERFPLWGAMLGLRHLSQVILEPDENLAVRTVASA